MFAASIQGEGVLAKSKSQSGLRYNAGLIPHGEPIHGCGSCVRDLPPTGFSEWELGPCQAERSPIFPPLFLVRTAIDPTKLATCFSLTRPWEDNLRVNQSTQNIIIISKQPVAPKTHICRLSPTIIVRQ